MVENREDAWIREIKEFFLVIFAFMAMIIIPSLLYFIVNYITSLKWDGVLKLVIGIGFVMTFISVIGLIIWLSFFENRMETEKKNSSKKDIEWKQKGEFSRKKKRSIRL